MTVLPDQAEVVIVGAGPTGLALAAEMRRLGGRPLLIDRSETGANTSRAAVVHARTLEVLRPLGVTDELMNRGVRVPVFRVRERDAVLLEIDFGRLRSPFPFTTMCPQNETEAVLLARLQSLGGDVIRPAEVKGVEARGEGLSLALNVDGSARTLQARWVVGCDGAHSVVRSCAGVGFEGGGYDEQFVLADVHMQWPLAREEVSLLFSPRGLVVVAPLPHDRFRIVATVADAPERPDPAFFEELLTERGPSGDQARIHKLVWSSRFRIQHRVASTLRAGRVLLCGDAAHVHSPAGGQGMNTGIQDAISLAPLLLAATKGGDHDVLNDWAAHRHAVAREVVRFTHRMTRAATLTSAPARWFRNQAISLAGTVPGVPDRIAAKLAELDQPRA